MNGPSTRARWVWRDTAATLNPEDVRLDNTFCSVNSANSGISERVRRSSRTSSGFTYLDDHGVRRSSPTGKVLGSRVRLGREGAGCLTRGDDPLVLERTRALDYATSTNGQRLRRPAQG